jgi:hypothetical protein
MATINSLETENALRSLRVGETLLVGAKAIAGKKVKLEFAEIIRKASDLESATSRWNRSDVRFGSGKARRCFLAIEPADVMKDIGHLLGGLDLNDLEYDAETAIGEEVELLVLNPTTPVSSAFPDGERVRVRVIDYLKPTEWDAANMAKAAINNGEGTYENNYAGRVWYTVEGQPMFSKTDLVFVQPGEAVTHKFIKHDAETTSCPRFVVPATASVLTRRPTADEIEVPFEADETPAKKSKVAAE